MWMNLLLLFFMSLIPLATGFLGEHPQLGRAISFYALIMSLSSAVFRSAPVSSRSHAGPQSRAHPVPPCHLGEELHRHAALCHGGHCSTVLAACGSPKSGNFDLVIVRMKSG
jgi:hypothetical protein